MEILLRCFTAMAFADSPTLYRSRAWDVGSVGVAKCKVEKANCRAALPKSTSARRCMPARIVRSGGAIHPRLRNAQPDLHNSQWRRFAAAGRRFNVGN